MTFSQEWRFDWEGSSYAWKRESSLGGGGHGKNEYSCWAIRAPDPNIWIAVYKPTSGGLRRNQQERKEYLPPGPELPGSSPAATGAQQQEPPTPTKIGRLPAPSSDLGAVEAFIQMLDHNIARMDVADRKGFELVLLMTLSTILDQDYDDKYRTPSENMYLSQLGIGVGTLGTAAPDQVLRQQNDVANSSGNLGVTSLLLQGRQRSFGSDPQAGPEAPPQNEVSVEAWGEQDDYVRHCINLLRDDGLITQPAGTTSSSEQRGQNLSIIVLKASSPYLAQKAVAIAAGVKAAFYKLPDQYKGKEAGEELYQYVRSEDVAATSSSAQAQAQGKPVEAGLQRVQPKAGGRPIIKLDAPSKTSSVKEDKKDDAPSAATSKGKTTTAAQDAANYIPPTSLTIYLSKERIAELEPKAVPAPRIPPKSAQASRLQAIGSSTSGAKAGQVGGRASMPGYVPSGSAPPQMLNGTSPAARTPPKVASPPPTDKANGHSNGASASPAKPASTPKKLFGLISKKH